MLDANPLPITSLLTGGLLILLVVLSGMVTARRAVLGGLEFGDGDDDVLRRRIRAHGNLVEIAPMVVLGVGLLEYAGAPGQFVLWAAVIFLFGRLLHALRMYLANPWIGLSSIISQHVICLGAGVWLLNRFLFSI